MDIRDEIITGTFAIGNDGRKEPPDWKQYALLLEDKIKELEKESTASDSRSDHNEWESGDL